MEILNSEELKEVSGAMNLQGFPQSNNVIDLQGTNMVSWIDAANTCWMPGTSSIIMYPGGFYIPNFRF